MITPAENRSEHRTTEHSTSGGTSRRVTRQIDEMLPAVRPYDLDRVAAGMREILIGIGEDPDRDGLEDTPARVAQAYRELFGGMHESPSRHLRRVFQIEHDEVILVRDIEFFSVCEHHLLPFVGKAHIAYLPQHGRVVGLSKLARTVEVFARRPQVQERLTRQIAESIMHHLDPRGVAVIVDAEHMCMRMRGVRNSHSAMVTTALRGVFETDMNLRTEVLNLIHVNRR